MLCKWGCGQEAKYFYKDGSGCCSDKFFRCPVKKQERSEVQKGEKNHAFGKTPWNKGLTQTTDIRVRNNTERATKTIQSQYLNKNRQIWNKGK